MKALKACLAFLLVLALCLSTGLCAYAEESEALPSDAEISGTEGSLAEHLSFSYTEMSWDDIVQGLLETYGAEYRVALGYLNLVTGEEHYYNGDEYMSAASMFKLPLCMYFTEHLASGDLTWNYDVSYESIRDEVLIDSSNEKALVLTDILGGYGEFRKATAEYTGVAYVDEPSNALIYNYYTPRELISVLRTLYTGRERFPDIIEAIQKALPDRFFKLHEQRYDIGHKAGWLTEESDVYVRNDSGIAFTTEPIAIVAFTQGISYPEEFLTAYCTAMCEYTEANAAPAPTPEPTPEPTPVPTPVPDTASAAPATEVTTVKVHMGDSLLPFVFIALFLIFGVIAAIVFGVKYRARVLTLLLSVVLAAAAMALSVIGTQVGTVYARPSGDPAATAEEFLSEICRGEYELAYRLLRDYSDLGLGAEPSTAAGRMVNRALHESYAYTLTGPCSVEMLDAVQPLRFRYLDLASLEAEAAEVTPQYLEKIVASRPLHEIYDENNNYLPSVTEEAYLAALDSVLQHADAHYAEVELELALTYTDGRWQVLASPAFLRALNGGAAY